MPFGIQDIETNIFSLMSKPCPNVTRELTVNLTTMEIAKAAIPIPTVVAGDKVVSV